MEKKQIIANNSNKIDDATQKLWALEISISKVVNKIIKCQK